MKSIRLAYGESGLDLKVDDGRIDATVITPKDPPAAMDPRGAFKTAVEKPYGSAAPLTKLIASKGKPIKTVCIVIADHTRPVPDRLLVPWIVSELGVPDSAVTVLIGTGTHRGSTPDEIKRMLGDAAGRFRVVNHDYNAPDLVKVGDSSCGGECWLNPLWVDADLKICTGFIEPHFYAGFSGGSKAVVPGVSGLKTVQHFHRSQIIAHPQTTWGDIHANPLQQLTREMLALCPPDFIVNVTLNLKKEITAVFAGELRAAHDAGCKHALGEAMVPVPRTYPVVVTTNSGYPLDQNYYQTVKGISAAARIVEPGGTILVASECRVGLPWEGECAKILADPKSNEELHEAIKATKLTRHDQWQVQTLLQCLEKARVILHSSLPPEAKKITRTEHGTDISASLAEAASAWKGAGRMPVAILPMGPLTIPYLQMAARS